MVFTAKIVRDISDSVIHNSEILSIETLMNTDQQPEDASNDAPEAENTQPEAAPPPASEPGAASSPPPTDSTSSETSGLSKDSLNMGMLCHLLAFTAFFTGVGSILGPLIIWLVKKDQDPYVDEQGKESLNFQISIAIYGIISAILMVAFIGFILIFVVAIAWFVLTIVGTIKASKGEPWKYPLTIRLIK